MFDREDHSAVTPGSPAAPVIIIGAGPIGLYAAFQAGMRGLTPVIADALPFVGGQCAALYPDTAIYDAPGFGAVAAGEFTDRIHEQLEPFEPIWLLGRRATSIWGDLEGGFNVEFDTGETATGAAVIFAGGAGALRPRRLAAKSGPAPTGLHYHVGEDAVELTDRAVAVYGAGEDAVDAAFTALDRSAAVTLIHDGPFTADQTKVDALRRAANARRLTIIDARVAEVATRDGAVAGVEIESTSGETEGERQRLDFDVLIVKAGLELIDAEITGLGDIARPATLETTTPGVFTIGDAVGVNERPAVIAAGFSEAIRAAEGAARRVSPDAPRALPHSASSPLLQARLSVA